MALEDSFVRINNPKNITEEDVAYDDCYNPNCKYVSKTGGEKQKCTFETCLFKEMPKHPRSFRYQCVICDTDYECNIEDVRLPICEACMVALKHIVFAHRNNCVECTVIEHESQIDQYLKEGDDGSNEDWNH